MSSLRFPDGFLWGAATASHQVEGSTYNDWSVWEHTHAARLACESQTAFAYNPHWETFRAEATNPANYLSDDACDHFHRYETDFDILQELHLNAYRFSLEWSRIEPTPGVFDPEALAHYRDVVHALRQRRIEPFVTLWHWTLPQWLADEGGILSPRFPALFARYTDIVVHALGPDVRFWITLNEPEVLAAHAYLRGQWPPQKKNPFVLVRALRVFIVTHRRAYAIIKTHAPLAQVGIAKHQISFVLGRNTFLNRLLKKIGHFVWNEWLLNRLQGTQDFIGLNHYSRNTVDDGFNRNPNHEQTDLGWEYCPESLEQAARELIPYHLPIYVTENGLADASDQLRARFIPTALAALHRAITAGADVRGYLHWSLLDNFEWDKGFWPRFGLVAVDRTTQTRTIRDSARHYASIAKANELTL